MKAWREPKHKEEPLFVRAIVDDESGDIDLCIVDDRGHLVAGGFLAYLDVHDGVFELCSGVDVWLAKRAGVALNDRGYLKVNE